MMRTLVILGALVALAGCTTGGAWYESGDASYDALKRANDACKATGGDFRLKKGGDSTHLGDFECVGGKGH